MIHVGIEQGEGSVSDDLKEIELARRDDLGSEGFRGRKRGGFEDSDSRDDGYPVSFSCFQEAEGCRWSCEGGKGWCSIPIVWSTGAG